MMENKKKYASYAEIDRELEILKLEKDLEYIKLLSSIQQTRDSLSPQSMVRNFLGTLPSFSWREVLQQSYGSLLNLAVPAVMGWFTKRKRGF